MTKPPFTVRHERATGSQRLKTSLARLRRQAGAAEAGHFEATLLAHLRTIERELQQLQTVVLARIYTSLERHFNDDELRALCFDLGVPYDDLPGRTRPGKITALIEHLDRRGRLPDLIHHVAYHRPLAAVGD
jgi:hypothetical protein